ncbi:MAG: hypothetical protein PHN24_12670 [Eubacteriales bacterium]|nr:hypothetical protein [Eubacteriales bacterium]
MYIAALCGNGIIREGAFGENVDMLRAVCSQIIYPSAETIDCIPADCDSLCIRAVYAFGDVARVAFYTAPILMQTLIPFCRTERVENKAEETDYICFSTQSKEYYIDIETLLTESWNWATMRSVLTILTPYESEKMPPWGLHDAEITIFDYLPVPTNTDVVDTIIIEFD